MHILFREPLHSVDKPVNLAARRALRTVSTTPLRVLAANANARSTTARAHTCTHKHTRPMPTCRRRMNCYPHQCTASTRARSCEQMCGMMHTFATMVTGNKAPPCSTLAHTYKTCGRVLRTGHVERVGASAPKNCLPCVKLNLPCDGASKLGWRSLFEREQYLQTSDLELLALEAPSS